MTRSLLVALAMSLVALGCSTDPADPVVVAGDAGTFYYTVSGDTYKVDLATNTQTQFLADAVSAEIVGNEVLAIEDYTDRIFFANMTGTSRRTVVEFDASLADQHRRYFDLVRASPDATRIAYDGGFGVQQVFVVDATSGALIATIGNSNEWFRFGDWLPDGGMIIEASGGVEGLYRVQPDLKTMTRIDPQVTRPSKPAVSKNGDIAFVVGGSELWTMKSDGSQAKRIVSGLSLAGYPVWNPAGTTVAISSDGKLRTVNVADGSSKIYTGWYYRGDDRADWK